MITPLMPQVGPAGMPQMATAGNLECSQRWPRENKRAPQYNRRN